MPTGGGPMIDLNTSTNQLSERTTQPHRRSPFSSSHGGPSHVTDTNKGVIDPPRTSSRSPVRTERSTPPNIKGPMFELAGGKQFHECLENAKHAISRSSSRSPVRTDVSHSPNEPMVELGSGKRTDEHQSNITHATSRSQSRSSLSSDHSNKSGHVEAMIELSSADRFTERQRSRSRSPESRPTSEAMIDLSSTSRLHERRGAPRMKPLDGMIDLNSMDNPASPLSPGFGILPFSSFPSQVYRPPNRQRYSYKSKHYRVRPQRGTPPAINSPGFSPRLPFAPHFNYPPNPRHRMPGSAMIDIGSLGKSNEFHGAVSSRSSEIPLRPVRSGTIPKRRHSIDSPSVSEPVKKPRVAGSGQQQDVKPRGSGIRLNVNDLLELEREEQKYIQNLSLVQSQLTEIQFKMQRMQQQLEKLQSSEMEIKQRIDVVRAKRVKILKDAQDNQESQGTSGVLGDGDMNTRRNKDGGGVSKRMGEAGDAGAVRDNEDDIVKDRDGKDDKEGGQEKACNRGSLGFHSSLDDTRDTMKNSSEKKSDNICEIVTSSYGGQSEHRNLSSDRNLAPSELVLQDMSTSHHPRVSNASVVQQYPIKSSSKDRSYHSIIKPTKQPGDWEDSVLSSSQEKLSAEIETFESSNGSTITLNSDGTLVLRKNNPESSQHASKRSNPTILEEACAGLNAKETECGGITSDESQQFLGCLEITSTTDEPATNDDDGPKEVGGRKDQPPDEFVRSSKALSF